MAVVPLSEAQVVLHLNATSEGTTDFVQLRAVNDVKAGVAGAPVSFEQDVQLDYRLPVDEHRSGLDPVLLRVLAPYLSLAVPGAVSVSVTTPNGADKATTKTSPWGFKVWGGGWGNWSDHYRSLSVWSGLSLSRKTNDNAQDVWVNVERSIELQPSLVVNSTEVELTSDSSSVVGALTAGWNLNNHWTLGGTLRGGHDDPEGQYLGTGRAHVGVEYNLFPSDDPRGNRLAVAWLVGGQGDAYNQTNTLGQDVAFFPTQLLLGSGSVRVDTLSLSLDLSVKSQIAPFFERYVLGASVETDLTLGDHVDLQLEFSATQQAIPGPSTIDTSDYEEVTRASYAEPLEMNGWLNLRFHWDNTNSARNNRFETVGDVQTTGGL
ncbi:hypothetical protein LBMAG42_45690 [Deltaproteobacteria bacterium]|nr:hypothetical protein LBMAG42_45690 [Deltaproteobacteria bacterium]